MIPAYMFSGIAVVGFAIAIFRAWDDQKNAREIAESRLATIENEKILFDVQFIDAIAMGLTRVFRIKIFNLHSRLTAHDVKVSLQETQCEEWSQEGGGIPWEIQVIPESLPLPVARPHYDPLEENEFKCNINPQDFRLFELISIKPEESLRTVVEFAPFLASKIHVNSLQMYIWRSNTRGFRFNDPLKKSQRWIITISISAKDVPMVPAQALVTFPAGGHLAKTSTIIALSSVPDTSTSPN